jgi:flavodoxin
MAMKSTIILYSYHHKNTEKIANAFGKVLDAPIKMPSEMHPEELREYDLIGFGSGIYAGKHHLSLLDLADKMPQVKNGKAFIFSTNGAPAFLLAPSKLEEQRHSYKNHLRLRNKLMTRGYTIVDEFTCPGFNTNSFLERFGGINRGRPNAEDIKRAEEFALDLKKKIDIRKDAL